MKRAPRAGCSPDRASLAARTFRALSHFPACLRLSLQQHGVSSLCASDGRYRAQPGLVALLGPALRWRQQVERHFSTASA
jgi:hypothetical protein